jgi:hypothetical protein
MKQSEDRLTVTLPCQMSPEDPMENPAPSPPPKQSGSPSPSWDMRPAMYTTVLSCSNWTCPQEEHANPCLAARLANSAQLAQPRNKEESMRQR